MKSIEVYDPALCCSSGVCGPAPDEALAAFAGAMERLKAQGVEVTRFNLAQEPLAFANQAEVKAILEKDGEDGLPLVFVDGSLYFRGVYPTVEQLEKVLGIDPSASEGSEACDQDSDCCSENDALETESQPTTFVKVAGPKESSASSCCEPGSGCC